MTLDDVIDYLIFHYGVHEVDAIELTKTHPETIERAIRLNSEPYYPAQVIAALEGIDHINPCEACMREDSLPAELKEVSG